MVVSLSDGDLVVSLSDDGHGCQSVRLWPWLLVCQIIAMVVSLSDNGHGCKSVI